jgi:hypothetical protein
MLKKILSLVNPTQRNHFLFINRFGFFLCRLWWLVAGTYYMSSHRQKKNNGKDKITDYGNEQQRRTQILAGRLRLERHKKWFIWIIG